MSARPSQPGREADRQITTVIPCFAAASTIGRAVRSALTQNGGDIRVIAVIDDGCPQTRRALEDLGEPRITILVNGSNLGAQASRNRGLAKVTTCFVSFLDSDDYFEGDLLGPLLEQMRSKRADIGFGPTVHLNSAGARRHAPHYRDHEDVFVRWFSGIQNVHTASVLWSTEYLRAIGGWDEAIRRNQDGELALRAILLGAHYACSFEGAGIWVNNEERPRITARSDNLGALIDVVAKFETMHSDVVSDDARLRACACQLRRIAMRAYREGELQVAADAMARRRRLGFVGPVLDPEKIIALALKPLSSKKRTAAYRLASLVKKRLVGAGPASYDRR